MITFDELRKLSKPYHMGYGCIRVPVKECAYHFYFDKTACDTMMPHQHQYNFTSTIQKGALKNTMYRITGTDPGSTLQLEERSPGPGLGRHAIESNVIITEAYSFTVYEGKSYNINWETYHTIEAVLPNTITLVCKGEYSNAPQRFILDKQVSDESPWPDGWKNVKSARDAYKDTMTESMCWEIIEEALNDNV